MPTREFISTILLCDGWHDVLQGTFRRHDSGIPAFGSSPTYTWLDAGQSSDYHKVRVYARAEAILALQMVTEDLIDT